MQLKNRLMARASKQGPKVTFKSAKKDKVTKELSEALDKVELKALGLAKELDEGPDDLAKQVKGAVVTAGDPLGWSDQGSLAMEFHDDGYTIESMSSSKYTSVDEMLTITKRGDRTIYRLKRGAYDSHNQYDVPSEIRNVLVIKDESGDDPTFKVVEGRIGIVLHSLAGNLSKLYAKIPSVQIQFKKTDSAV